MSILILAVAWLVLVIATRIGPSARSFPLAVLGMAGLVYVGLGWPGIALVAMTAIGAGVASRHYGRRTDGPVS